MVTKQMTSGGHTHTAVNNWKFGGKLKGMATDFPDETSVEYNYDGFGKRRNKYVSSTGAVTWYRWDLGWNTVAAYTDPDADWDIEGRSMTYIGKLAEVEGDDPTAETRSTVKVGCR